MVVYRKEKKKEKMKTGKKKMYLVGDGEVVGELTTVAGLARSELGQLALGDAVGRGLGGGSGVELRVGGAEQNRDLLVLNLAGIGQLGEPCAGVLALAKDLQYST
jgi:hypothetical protein